MFRSAGARSVISAPPSTMRPPLGCSSPATRFIKVLLPQPDGPTSTRNSPSSNESLISCNTRVLPNDLWMPCRTRSATTIGSLSALDRASHQAAHEVLTGQDIHEERRDGGNEG